MPETTPNLRDVGGLVTADGRPLATGRVLRSAVPSARDVGPDGITWPPPVVIDLRSPGESEPIHPLAQTGVRVVNLPLLAALRPGARPIDSLQGLYLLMLEQSSMYLVELVREIGRAPGATLIHCAAGKDRTGVSIALLLRLVGVSRETVLDDYLLTADAEAAIMGRLRKGAGHRHRSTLPPSFAGVSPEAITAVLDHWDAHPEGVEGWFLEIGGTTDLLDRLRRTLLS
ncbi:tyrosine-protein phosphatase [Aeromicrobium chenweiae]|uniref:Protein tyrosine phosphatase n=1 Tax=Aeromicrobium chenweiae TaxID=2079793 RepID=A0A2S0WJM6_9ACTN|nr:tyrosine-protein phosphatase [Aeromicrobium chenweiae]AWB91492.1 protein tyrosine phosphatase [Aeromicrobium chenweiae]TGN29975.1 tyrosine-protein phosphatase [Aeromicrobium chenweiae]